MDFFKTKIITGILLLTILGFIALISMNGKKYNRYVLYFKNSITNKIENEIRYVPVQNIKEHEVAFVEELMLGSVNHENYKFLQNGNNLNACFVKNNILYIDFPVEFMKIINSNVDSDILSELLRKNILTNCPNLDSVFISVDGLKIYEFFKK